MRGWTTFRDQSLLTYDDLLGQNHSWLSQSNVCILCLLWFYCGCPDWKLWFVSLRHFDGSFRCLSAHHDTLCHSQPHSSLSTYEGLVWMLLLLFINDVVHVLLLIWKFESSLDANQLLTRGVGQSFVSHTANSPLPTELLKWISKYSTFLMMPSLWIIRKANHFPK